MSHHNSSGFDAGLRRWTPCQLLIPKFLLLRDSWLHVSNRGQDCSTPGSPVFRYLLEFAQVLEAGSNLVHPGGGRQSPREDSKWHKESVRLFISLTRAFGTCLKLHLVSLKGAVASTFAFPWGASGSIRTVWRLSQSSQISDVTFYRIGCLGYFVTGFIIVIWFFFSSPFAPTTFLFFFSKSLLVDGYSLPSALPPYTY